MDNIDVANKPSRNELYFKHAQLKVKTQKLMKKYGVESQITKWTDHNFKKTTNFKPLYSCHGYGGKCGMCKGNEYNTEKQSFKNIDMKTAFKEWKISFD